MQRLRLSSVVTRVSIYGSKLSKHGNQRCASGIAATAKKSETVGKSLPSHGGSQLAQRGGALALFGAMGVVGYYAFDDLLIYDQCSSRAMETASQDPRLKEILGGEIHRGPWHWYKASIAIAHNRHSASCSFPVSGSDGTGSLHLKAVRFHGSSDEMVGGGGWVVLMLEALIPNFGSENSTPELVKINLMQTSDDLKTGDGTGGGSIHCLSSSVQEV